MKPRGWGGYRISGSDASGRAVPVDEALHMVTLYETWYTGWTVTHVHERGHAEPGGRRSYNWTKKALQAAGHVGPGHPAARGASQAATGTPLPGMMLHQDGSTQEWVPSCQWDVMVPLDEATTEIYSAFLVEEEGTLSCLRGLQEVMETTGLFSFLYTDRGSHDWSTDEAGGKVDKTRLTQEQRDVQPLRITLLPVSSPEARGWSERAFRTEKAAATGISPSGLSRPTTSALRCRPSKSGQPSSRGSARPAPRCSVCKAIALSPRTIPCPLTASGCRSRKNRTGSMM
jgi:hypothetical protein